MFAYEFVDEIVTIDGAAYICTDEEGYFIEITYTLSNDIDTMIYEDLSDCYNYARASIG